MIVFEQWQQYQIDKMRTLVEKIVNNAIIKWHCDERQWFYALESAAGFDVPGNIYLVALRAKLNEVCNG